MITQTFMWVNMFAWYLDRVDTSIVLLSYWRNPYVMDGSDEVDLFLFSLPFYPGIKPAGLERDLVYGTFGLHTVSDVYIGVSRMKFVLLFV